MRNFTDEVSESGSSSAKGTPEGSALRALYIHHLARLLRLLLKVTGAAVRDRILCADREECN